MLVDLDTRDVGLDRLKGTADLRRRVRLRVPGVDVAWPAALPNEDYRLRRGLGGGAILPRRRLRLQHEQVRHAQPAHDTEHSHLEEIPAIEALAIAHTELTLRHLRHLSQPTVRSCRHPPDDARR